MDGSISVSVVIPLFNKEGSIARAIDSVLGQDFPVSEIIVVDDGSTDRSRSVAENYTRRGVRIIKQENRGVSAARNAGIENASSDLIALLDADDIWNPDHVSNLVGLVVQFPEARLFSTLISDNKKRIGARVGADELVKEYGEFVLENGWCVNSSCVMFHRSVWVDVGGFPEGETHGEDIVTWFKMSELTPVAISRKVDAYYDRSAGANASFFIKDQDGAFVKYIDEKIISDPGSVDECSLEIRNKMILSKSFFLVASGKVFDLRGYIFRARLTKRFRFFYVALLALSFFPARVSSRLAVSYLKLKSGHMRGQRFR